MIFKNVSKNCEVVTSLNQKKDDLPSHPFLYITLNSANTIHWQLPALHYFKRRYSA